MGAALTRTGMIAGTPAYMAPEQLTAEPVTAASDQFGFCVTAWEVLFGRRPFQLGAIVALLQSILDGRIERPENIEVPPAVEAALRKGLQYRPKRRHRSMKALLAVLDDELRRIDGLQVPRRGRRGWTAAGVAAAGLAAVLGVWSLRSDGPSCRPDPSAFDGVWDDARKSAMAATILGSPATFATDTWARLAPAIDDWRDHWLAAHVDACEATHVRGEQSPELLDLRMQCLNDRRVRFDAFLDVLAEGSVDAIAEADDAFAELPGISRCANARYVRRSGSRPDDPEVAARIDAVERGIAFAEARLAAQDYDAAQELAGAAIAEAVALEDPRTEARARLVLGTLRVELQEFASAESELQQAYLLARRADDPETAASSARRMIAATGVGQQRFAEGRWWLGLAEIEAERTNDAMLGIRTRTAKAQLLAAEGNVGEAAATVQSVLDEVRGTAGFDERYRAEMLVQLGKLLISRGDAVRAIEVIAEARESLVAGLGVEHPVLARVHVQMARARRTIGDLEGSAREIEDALRIAEQAFGERHVSLYPVLDERADVRWARGDVEGTLRDLDRARNLDTPRPLRPLAVGLLLGREGNTWLGAGQPERAEPLLRRAIATIRAEVGDRHYLTARHRVALAAALAASGQRGEAEKELEQGLAIGEALLGRDHPEIAVVHDEIALIRQRAGDLEGALHHTLRALEIVRALAGGKGLAVVRAEGNTCSILQELGRTEEAASHCEIALAIARRVEGIDLTVVADLENNLGAVLVARGRLGDATESYRRAHDTWVARFGPDSKQVAIALANLAEVRELDGDLDGARPLFARSLAIRERAVGASHPSLVVPLLGLARTALAQKDPHGALAYARRAVGICGENPTPPLTLARSREQLARALWSVGDRRDARQEARRALDALQAVGPRGAIDDARIRAWLERL